jgi:bisphosphoglycerate-independent phosphoglycerate mutase (AlkP superfamily)
MVTSQLKEKYAEDAVLEVRALVTNWSTLRKNAEKIRKDRIETVVNAYNLILSDTIKDYNEDIQDYYKKALHDMDMTPFLLTKLINSYLAPRHDMLKVLKQLTKSERDATKIAKWYGRYYGQDNGWMYISKEHLKGQK